jgi:hypothetical protein
MQTVLKGFCTPEKFRLLQRVFDEAWIELEARGNGGIDDPEPIRSKLAALVVEMMDIPDLDAELAKQDVLQKLNGGTLVMGPTAKVKSPAR